MRMIWILILLPTAALAGNFTAIGEGTSWQSTNFVNEFYIAIDERSQAAGQGSYTTRIEVGENLQSTNVWQPLQSWIQAKCTNFVATNLTIDGVSRDPITNWTWSTLNTHLGMESGRWRRATSWDVTVNDWENHNDAMYIADGNGYMQAGDIIGPWIFDDLQKALKCLDWTSERRSVQSAGTGSVTNWSSASGSGNSLTHGSYYAAWTNAVAVYAGSKWTTNSATGSGYYYWCYRHKTYSGTPGRYIWTETRWRSYPLLTGITVPAGLTYDWDLYLLANSATGDDMDSTGWSRDHLYLIDSNTTESATTVTASLYGNSDTQPFDCAPTNNWQGDWPIPPGGDTDSYHSYLAWWVLKWNFTYE